MTATTQDLPKILADHKKWIDGPGGTRADLSRADLSRADLSRTDLSGANLSRTDLTAADLSAADLSGAYLYEANLYEANLYGANLYGANLSRADLSGANLYGADLSRANLSGANLSRANLSRANLSGANLSRANLSRADLTGANLYGTNGLRPLCVQPLLMLYDQPGKIRAYKLVTADGISPMQTSGQLKYEIGKTIEVDDASSDATKLYAAGINVATLDWCIREWHEGWRVLIVEFAAKDIACVPTASDGKFRLHTCTVVGEKDLTELGLHTCKVVGEKSLAEFGLAAAPGGRE